VANGKGKLPPAPTFEDLLEVFRRAVPPEYYRPIEEGENGEPHPSFAIFRGLASIFETVAEKGSRTTAARFYLPSAIERDDPSSSGRPAGIATGTVSLARVGPTVDALVVNAGDMRLVFDGGVEGAREYLNAAPVVWNPNDSRTQEVEFVSDVLGFVGNLEFVANEDGTVDLDLISIKDQDTERAGINASIISGPSTVLQDTGKPDVFEPSDVGLYVRITGAGDPANVGQVRKIAGFDWPEIEIPVGSGRYPRRVTLEDTVRRDLVEALQDDGGAFTDYAVEARSYTADGVPLLPAAPALGDAFYFGFSGPISGVVFDLTTVGVGDWTIVWEYWDGAAWQALADVDDPTNGFRAPGGAATYSVSWTVPPGWTALASPSGSGLSLFFARARLSAFVASTTSPASGRLLALSDEPLAPESGTVSWTLLDFEALGLSLASVEAFTGGRDDDLYLLGDDRGVYQQPGESDSVFRDRASRLADVVSPNAILRTINRILRPLGFAGAVCDVQDGGIGGGYTGLFMDTDADLAPDRVAAFDLYGPGDLFPEADFFVLQSATEAYGWFLVKLPLLGAGDFGIFCDEGPLYFDDSAEVYYGPSFFGFMDGSPVDGDAAYAAIYSAIDAIKAGGVGFTLIKSEELTIP